MHGCKSKVFSPLRTFSSSPSSSSSRPPPGDKDNGLIIPESVSGLKRPRSTKIDSVTMEFTEEQTAYIEQELGRGLNEFEKTRTVSFDRRGLLKAKEFDELTEEAVMAKEDKTPLVDFLRNLIMFKNPMGVNEYMQICLGHPEFGYYSAKTDVLGAEGDFVTSPEISPVFNELVCVWVASTWMQMGSPASFQLVECGPGKGTMMKGILDTAFELRAALPGFYEAIHVQLVETSAVMRSVQAEALDVNLDLSALEADSAALISMPSVVARDRQSEKEWLEEREERMRARLKFFGDQKSAVAGTTHSRTLEGMDGALVDNKDSRVPVSWQWRVEDIATRDGEPLIVLGHEFLDALPVRQFQRTPRGWCERLVTLDNSADNPQYFQFVLAPSSQGASSIYLPPNSVLSAREEDTIEVSPGVQAVCQAVYEKIDSNGGAVLFIDYGADAAPANSIQAVKDHKFTHFFEQPGLCDLTAHVDFSAMRRVAQANDQYKSLAVHPLITQREFLRELGIGPRVERLLEGAEKQGGAKEEEAQNLHDAYMRLVSDESEHPQGMGTLFKAFCVSNIPQLKGGEAPVGFASANAPANGAE
jgi:NADH dehydrogenase [ubiquinone] 1 alpha subcomplex assembly factor 7